MKVLFFNFVIVIIFTMKSVNCWMTTYENVPQSDNTGDGQLILDRQGSCSCSFITCNCCAGVKDKHLNATVCAKISYRPSLGYEYVWINVNLLLDGMSIHNSRISAQIPTATVCAFVPRKTEQVKICLRFYNLSVPSQIFKLSGCVNTIINDQGVILIGCFKMPLGRSHIYRDGSRRFLGYGRQTGVKGQDNTDQKLYFNRTTN